MYETVYRTNIWNNIKIKDLVSKHSIIIPKKAIVSWLRKFRTAGNDFKQLASIVNFIHLLHWGVKVSYAWHV